MNISIIAVINIIVLLLIIASCITAMNYHTVYN